MDTVSVAGVDFQPDARGMFDLYLLHRAKLDAGLASIHPQRWLKSKLTHLSFDRVIRGFEAPPSFALLIGKHSVEHAYALRAVTRQCNVRKKVGFYFGNSPISGYYAAHVPSGKEIEGAIQDEMWEGNEDMELEVNTEFGRIDCLTKTELIEIKDIRDWKHGMGQLLIYGKSYPRHRKVLHLYSLKDRENCFDGVKSACLPFSVTVRYQQLKKENEWRLDRTITFRPATA